MRFSPTKKTPNRKTINESSSKFRSEVFPCARTVWQWRIEQLVPNNGIGDFLAAKTGLSKNIIKDCLEKGAVWLKRPGQGERRLRKGRFLLRPGDRLAMHYDAQVLARIPPVAACVFQHKRYSVWDKPAFMLSQGSRAGDHCSLLRQVEKTWPGQTIHLIHRLDREARGLMLFAHDRQAAAAFSQLFQSRAVEKRYQARIVGTLAAVGESTVINTPLDGKESLTEVTVLANENGQSLLDARIHSGRFHQIRRHLAGIGHPLIGDRRYNPAPGAENLQLVAWLLAFTCPYSGEKQRFQLDEFATWPSSQVPGITIR
ncbi:MAG: RluA family pseudouridine synthase [Desulfobulbaceae bacterium]|jgi:tRNA pseudouridine32 synthase/23S rRNA pseudouridine746 synthase|nr:RluA family pseudouridine synthase [Desulfobulbaceae bacterium]